MSSASRGPASLPPLIARIAGDLAILTGCAPPAARRGYRCIQIAMSPKRQQPPASVVVGDNCPLARLDGDNCLIRVASVARLSYKTVAACPVPALNPPLRHLDLGV